MAVDLEWRDRVAIITLNRPEARNAIDSETAAAIEAAVDRIEADESIWVSVITGAGTTFCAGADLKAVASGNGRGLSTERGGFAGLVRRARAKPMVAALNGPAMAGGCEIALACDLIVAADDSSFGMPEVKRSLMATAGGLFRLPRAIGPSTAMEMLLTGDALPARRLYELGLVNQLVPRAEVLSTALELACRVAANAPLAVRKSREVIAQAMNEDDAALWALGSAGMDAVSKTEDFKEGPRAFVEKRAPVWRGS